MEQLKCKQFWESTEEAQACLKEWKDKLGLSDWHIILKVTTEVPKDSLGFCQPDFTHRYATIWIAAAESGKHKDNAIKTHQEYMLIHELIHCIIPILEDTTRPDTMTEGWYNMTIHQIIERMARAMYAAKYNLKADWFHQ